VASHQETSEDKTLPLLDVEKRLEAKTALRDRLTALLKEPGQRPIGELAALEKQISDIQGEIESATAQRDYLKTITETIKVEVTYFGQPDTVAGIDFSPLRWAFSDSLVTLIGSAAQLVTFIAAALPWLPLFAFVFWLGRRWRRRASSTA
jgi:hypothetical protein